MKKIIKKVVISRKNLPTKIPIFFTAMVVLMLDYWNAPEWLWGIVLFLLSVNMIFSIYLVITQKEKNILVEEETKRAWNDIKKLINELKFQENVVESKLNEERRKTFKEKMNETKSSDT